MALLLAAGPGAALERWTAGAGGRPWSETVESRSSRNVEVTPQGQLQPERVGLDRNLSLGVYDRGGWYTGAGGNLIWSGTINGAFDGDPTTAAIINFSRGRITEDLGAPYPVSRIRFFPRPNFPLRYIPGFEIYVNDGALPPDFSGMDMWTLAAVTVQGITTNRIDWKLLYERRENLEREVDLSFPRQYVRFLQVSDFETATWEMAELEVYGEGYVGQARYVSKVIDLGGPADFGSLAWEVEMDPGTETVLRSRSGSTPDPYLYYRLTGIGPSGQTRVTDENQNGTAWDEYDRLRDDKGDATLDVEHWSYWSPPYDIPSGGEPMISPGPRRYVQFQMDFRAGNSFDDGVRARSLSLEYSRPPLADLVLGEIAPATVAPGAVTTFTYALAGRFGQGQRGFDTIEITTPVAVDSAAVREVTVGGVPVGFGLVVGADRFTLQLPQRIQRADEVVTFQFDCPVYVPGTRFEGVVYDRSAASAGQQIVAGDASPVVDTEALAVGWDLEGELIGGITVAPDRVTPNGDGINDEARITLRVLQLLEAATVSLEIYDLSGRLVWEFRGPRRSGLETVVWPAVDGSGKPVLPGTYIYRIAVDAAAGRDTRTGVIAVAY
ncbi:MAG: gliding motility-associated C-terminal domain-containing protein [Gemmatimonadota bacterium]